MTIRILIADDDQLTRSEMKRAIDKNYPELELIAEAKDGQESVTFAKQYKPDIVIMDINMPNKNGIDAAREILKISSKIKIIFFSIYSDKRYVKATRRLGAWGYIAKEDGFEKIRSAIQVVNNNKKYFNNSIVMD